MSRAKHFEFLRRRKQRDAARDRFNSARDGIPAIIADTTISRTVRNKRLRAQLNVIRRKAWAVATLDVHPPDGVSLLREAPLCLPADIPSTHEQVAKAYGETNRHILQSDGPFLVLCLDEADMSIYRYAALFQGVVIVFSRDSDFNMIPRPDEVAFTVSWRRQPPGTLAKRPWVLTNNRALHEFKASWGGQQRKAHMMALLLGQDYFPGGVLGLGCARIQQEPQLLCDVSSSLACTHVRRELTPFLAHTDARRHHQAAAGARKGAQGSYLEGRSHLPR